MTSYGVSSRSPRASDLAPPHDAALATSVMVKSLAPVIRPVILFGVIVGMCDCYAWRFARDEFCLCASRPGSGVVLTSSKQSGRKREQAGVIICTFSRFYRLYEDPPFLDFRPASHGRGEDWSGPTSAALAQLVAPKSINLILRLSRTSRAQGFTCRQPRNEADVTCEQSEGLVRDKPTTAPESRRIRLVSEVCIFMPGDGEDTRAAKQREMK